MLTEHAQNPIAAVLADRLLPFKRVLEVTSLSRATLYRKIGDGSFPAPLKIGRSRIAWRERILLTGSRASREPCEKAPVVSGRLQTSIPTCGV